MKFSKSVIQMMTVSHFRTVLLSVATESPMDLLPESPMKPNDEVEMTKTKLGAQRNDDDHFFDFSSDKAGILDDDSSSLTLLSQELWNNSEKFDASGLNFQSQNWMQLGSDIDGEAAGDQSGSSVALSSDGTVLAIGAIYNGGTAFGHVRVYQYANGAWTQRGKDIDGEATGDYSGWSISLSSDGSVLAIGATLNDGNGIDSGHVRIYQFTNNAWSQRGSDIDGVAAGDRSGYSVSLSSDGSIVAIGAPNKYESGSNAGHVRVYQYSNGAWTQRGKVIDGEAAGDWFGSAVSLSSNGSVVAVGAYLNDGSGANAGHVRVYQYGNGAWTQRGSDLDGDSIDKWFGYSVSLSNDGTILAVGAPYNHIGSGSDAGHVRVYKYSGDAWTQLGGDINGQASGDQFGISVSLSDDGISLAIGALNNKGGGRDAGRVQVYQYTGHDWIQHGGNIDGEADYDTSGYSVSLSSDGSIVAIGAIYNQGNGYDAGHVRVYQYTNALTTKNPTSSPSKKAGSNKWYMNYFIAFCVKDCVGGAPCGGLASPFDYLFETIEACCAARNWWNGGCIYGSRTPPPTKSPTKKPITTSPTKKPTATPSRNPIPSPTNKPTTSPTPVPRGTNLWYFIDQSRKCVRDCIGKSPCGGLAKNWDPKYGTKFHCCATRAWWTRLSCMIK